MEAVAQEDVVGAIDQTRPRIGLLILAGLPKSHWHTVGIQIPSVC